MSPNESEEIQVQYRLNECVDSFESFRFNAGAGAGKTFALVQTIRHVVKNKIHELEKRNQKIICITYTNVAVREIKERLGSSEIVLISTIHERLWDVIRPYQPELVKLHLKKLREELERTSEELLDKTNKKLEKFANLTDEQRSEFEAFAIKHRNVYVENQDANSKDFNSAYASVENKPAFFPDLIKNYKHFIEIVKRIYKSERYRRCISDIESNKKSRVEYDSDFNSDRLEFMKFSHDTLLNYSCKLFEEYPILQRVMIDKYPYIFIDEYQDTSEKVIHILKNLYHTSKKIKKNWLVGYFGDTAQNIYDDGVGLRIKALHPEVVDIDKAFNRRSHKKIIEIINAIRNDNIVQIPIFEDRTGGNVAFFFSTSSEDKKAISLDFLDRYGKDINKDENSETKDIHCLVLTNKLVAELSKFGDIQRAISRSNIFHRDLNTKFLSHDLEKLHPTMLVLYRIIKLRNAMFDDCSTYADVLGKVKGKVAFSDAHDLFRRIRLLEPQNLRDFIISLSNEISSELCEQNLRLSLLNNLTIKLRTDDATDLETYVLNKIKDLMKKPGNSAPLEGGEESDKIETLLNIDLIQWHRWVDFIDRKDEGKGVVFHTYHGTKGEEYENVAIIMEHSFGKEGKDKFKKYFLRVGSLGAGVETDVDYQNSKNLLYVACSRAIKNLRILYIDDIDHIRDGIESIFGEIFEWKMPRE